MYQVGRGFDAKQIKITEIFHSAHTLLLLSRAVLAEIEAADPRIHLNKKDQQWQVSQSVKNGLSPKLVVALWALGKEEPQHQNLPLHPL